MALRAWLRILANGQPRPILAKEPRPSDAVIFTDEAIEPEDPVPTAGRVTFAWWRGNPVGFSCEVPHQLPAAWLPRKNQIALAELPAAVQVLKQWREELVGKLVIGLIDSDCVLDALAKGQARQEDSLQD